MNEVLHSEETTKHENINQRRYWGFFLLLTVFLALMVKFPVRFNIEYSFDDALLWAFVSLACIRVAFSIYRNFGKHSYRLIAVVLLCSILSAWQVMDLEVLRRGGPSVTGFGSAISPSFTMRDGIAWYLPRFPNKNIQCNSIYERYIGNDNIAITVEIKRDATWFACGG